MIYRVAFGLEESTDWWISITERAAMAGPGAPIDGVVIQDLPETGMVRVFTAPPKRGCRVEETIERLLHDIRGGVWRVISVASADTNRGYQVIAEMMAEGFHARKRLRIQRRKEHRRDQGNGLAGRHALQIAATSRALAVV